MRTNEKFPSEPVLLTLPGIDNSGPGHWQTIWERERSDMHRVHFGSWNNPERDSWVRRLNAAIATAGRPVVLVAHSLGCHAVAWWNASEPTLASQVVAAFLVAPPDVEHAPIDHRLQPFGPVPRNRLAFPALVVGSRNDPYASYGHVRAMARIWGARIVDAGPMGHINSDSGLLDWPYGKYLVRRLIEAVTPSPLPLLASGAVATMQGQGIDTRAPR